MKITVFILYGGEGVAFTSKEAADAYHAADHGDIMDGPFDADMTEPKGTVMLHRTSDKAIADLAFDYISKRRLKIRAKGKRDQFLRKCEPDYGNSPCWMGDLGPVDSGDWCEHCIQADLCNNEYHALAAKTGGALRKLERRIASRTEKATSRNSV